MAESIINIAESIIKIFNPKPRPPPPSKTFLNNSKATQYIKIKFFKFNLILLGVILHIMTILIDIRCCHGNHLFWMCCGIEKWRNLHICQDIGLILLKFGSRGYFRILKRKSTIKLYTTSFWRQNDVKIKYQYIACRKCIWRDYHVTFCLRFLKTSVYPLFMSDYYHTKFGLIWVKESKVTGVGADFTPSPGWECINPISTGGCFHPQFSFYL